MFVKKFTNRSTKNSTQLSQRPIWCKQVENQNKFQEGVDGTIQYAQMHEVETFFKTQDIAAKRMRRVFTFRVRSDKDGADGRTTQRNADAAAVSAARAREKQREKPCTALVQGRHPQMTSVCHLTSSTPPLIFLARHGRYPSPGPL